MEQKLLSMLESGSLLSSSRKPSHRKKQMSVTTIIIALLWGALAGFLTIHLLANLLAVLFCLHGLLLTRWKRLAHKAATGVVKYAINLRLLLRVMLYALLFGGLLYYGDANLGKGFHLHYPGADALLFYLAATLAALSRLNAMRKRSTVIWRMSHDFDYAERRQRTQMLKS